MFEILMFWQVKCSEDYAVLTMAISRDVLKQLLRIYPHLLISIYPNLHCSK